VGREGGRKREKRRKELRVLISYEVEDVMCNLHVTYSICNLHVTYSICNLHVTYSIDIFDLQLACHICLLQLIKLCYFYFTFYFFSLC
jgi:hypothetical protein